MPNEVFLSLGSNINPEKNICLALEYLNRNFDILAVSNTWQTKSVGTIADDFLNTAVKLHTKSDMDSLKDDYLRQIEQKMGRVRLTDKNAPRTIDLDIVIFNGIVIDTNLFRFEYLILPFSEIIPEIIDSVSKRTLIELAREIPKESCCRIFKQLFVDPQKSFS